MPEGHRQDELDAHLREHLRHFIAPQHSVAGDVADVDEVALLHTGQALDGSSEVGILQGFVEERRPARNQQLAHGREQEVAEHKLQIERATQQLARFVERAQVEALGTLGVRGGIGHETYFRVNFGGLKGNKLQPL